MSQQAVIHMDAIDFPAKLKRESVALLAIDPPYYGITTEGWDNDWSSPYDYAVWLCLVLVGYRDVLLPDASIVFFGGIGKPGCRPLFEVMRILEGDEPDGIPSIFTFRNMITWKKRRGYGKSHDYLFCREEILWYSKSNERTKIRFNIPLTNTKRGYAGFNSKYPARSEYKRVSNVWDDIPEIMKPSRACEKPVALLRRIVETHSHPGDLVVDCFAGTGVTGRACVQTGRAFLGCDADITVIENANAAIQQERERRYAH